MNDNLQNNKTDEIDLMRLFTIIKDKLWIIVLSSLATCGLAFLYLRTQPNIYQADLLLQIEQKNSGVGALLGNIDSLIEGRNNGLDSQAEIIKSRSILSHTVEQFHLTSQLMQISGLHNIFQPVKNIPYSKIDFQLTVPHSFWSVNQKHKLTFKVSEDNKQWILKDNGQVLLTGHNGIPFEKAGYKLFFKSSADLSNREFAVILRSKLAAINYLRSLLSIQLVDKNSLLRLKINNQDPVYAAKLLNNIATDYVANNAKQGAAKLAQGAEFIESQLPSLRNKLEKAESELNSFQTQNKTVNLSTESETLIRTLAQIEGQLTALELKTDELASRYTPKHPSMQAVFRQREVLLSRKNEIERQLSHLPKSNQGFIRLKRDVEVNQSIYLQLLSRLQELNVAKASSVGGVQIVDPAQPLSQIIKPKRLIVLLLATIAGFILSTLVVLIRYMNEYLILSIEDVVDNTGLQVIATVPESKRQKAHEKYLSNTSNLADESSILSVADSNDPSIEALRSLRTSLHFSLRNTDNNILIVSGPTEDVGKSFVSTNLAVLLAQSGKKVVLVNGDLRKGYLDLQFNHKKEIATLTNYLTGKLEEMTSCIHKTKITDLSFIPCGIKPNNPAESFISSKFSQLISYLNENYDVVIIDTPPILPINDALQLSIYTKNILLVARYNKTSVRDLVLTQQRIQGTELKIIGVVINGVSKKKNNYNYYSEK